MNGAAINLGKQPIFKRMAYGKPLTFNPNNHRYTWDGNSGVRSVTGICNNRNKPALIQWASDAAVDFLIANSSLVRDAAAGHIAVSEDNLEKARKAHQTIKESAGDIGTLVHAYALQVFTARHQLPLPDGPERAACQGFLEFFTTHEIHPVELEYICYSEQLNYAGRFDFFGRINGRLGFLDIKTGGTRIYPETWLQLTGYQMAMHEEFKYPEETVRWALHINKATGKFTLHPRGFNVDHLKAWQSLVLHDAAMKKWSKEDLGIYA